MNKSPQCNQQQAELKQCKSEVEELHILQYLETGHCSIDTYLKINSGFHAKENFFEETLYIWK